MHNIALFSDIHGNYHALQAVLNKINQIGADQIFCLGDILFNHAGTDEVVELLDQNNVFMIRGNHDEPLNDITLNHFKNRGWALELEHWLKHHTNPSVIERLASLPTSHQLTLNSGEELLLFHAHPDNLWARINSAHAPHEELVAAFGSLPADILAYGHYHQPHFFRLNGKLLINVASVDSHTNVIPDDLTRFTMLHSQSDRTVVTQYTLTYDIEAQNKMDSEKNPPGFPESSVARS